MNGLHLTAILVIKAVFVGAEDAKETDLTTVCHAAIYLAALEEQLSTEVGAAKTDVTELDNHRRRLTLAAEIGSGTDAGCFLAAAAAVAAQHTKEASEAINTAIKNKAEGLKHLAHFTKTAEAAVKMSNTEFEIKTGAHKQVTASSTAHKLTPKVKTPAACQVTKTQKTNDKWQTGGKDTEPKLIEKFITADSEAIIQNLNPSIIAITYNSRCGGSDTWTSCSAAQKSCTIDNIATIGAGQTATPATAEDATQGKTKKIKIYKDDKPDQGCEPLPTNGGKDDDQKTSLYKICKALTTEIKMPTPLDLTGPTLAEIPIVKQVAKGCLQQYKDKTEMKPADEENLTTFFKNAYTDSTTKFEAKFNKLFADTKMLVYRGGKVQPVTIDTIIDGSEEHDALSRLRAIRAASAQASDKSVDTTSQKELGKDAGDNKGVDKKDEECKGKLETNCDTKKCTWDTEKK
uniref:Variant surface glycoprotein 1125.4777 n=1 Tax=Trypanosoma brucei TaxID=5691 RepID=A0A1J0RAN6_9TRYP|nr:variant surface glycoprotein 1125.4777 [Trypanosoma brucei]